MPGLPGLLHDARLLLARAGSIARALETNFFWDPTATDNLPRELQRWASERPGDPFLSFEGRRWTVGSFDAEVNRHARAWRALGLRAGQVVALMLENRPEFLFHFYALGKLGVVASLINPALHGPALRHALHVCEPAAILVGDEQLPGLLELADDLPVADDRVLIDVELAPEVEAAGVDWSARAAVLAAPRWACWNQRVIGVSPLPIPDAERQVLSEVAAYIYTSGTTGLPKPAVVKHHRLRRACDVFGGLARLTGEDAIYVALPLYHASGTAIGVPAAIGHRCRLVLARRFSASRFWRDCRDNHVSVCLYIGELCRYLHNQPPGPGDRDHQVRCFVGNGLREDIWDDFCRRFAIERVVEFYAATEGNAETANLFNLSGTVGPLLFWKMALIRWDEQREQPWRDHDGFCRRAKLGEPGLLIGRIDDKNPYAGYTDAEASARKILRDVFAKGDAWFDTGDLLRADHWLHLHFVDRLGDTFRWKGENVSTQEVAEILNRGPGVRESNVYGVEVPGTEGRAGMAAMVVDAQAFSPAGFFAHVAAALPDYAQPRFLRLVESMGTTGTFKHKKTELREQGWDPEAVTDPLLLRDPRGGSYVPLTSALRQQLLAGAWPI